MQVAVVATRGKGGRPQSRDWVYIEQRERLATIRPLHLNPDPGFLQVCLVAFREGVVSLRG